MFPPVPGYVRNHIRMPLKQKGTSREDATWCVCATCVKWLSKPRCSFVSSCSSAGGTKQLEGVLSSITHSHHRQRSKSNTGVYSTLLLASGTASLNDDILAAVATIMDCHTERGNVQADHK